MTLERRLAAFWFADLVGYTRLSAHDEDGALAAVDALQEAAREVVSTSGGRVVKFSGDAVLAEFASVQNAVDAAVALGPDLERRLADRALEPRALRIGVHAGEIAAAPDGDVYGDDVNLAARIQAAADPGRVVVSEDVVRQLRPRGRYEFEPLGERVLRGIDERVALFAVRAPVSARPTASRGPAPADERSVAVLPFANLSPDPANEYFSDGVTEEILAVLAQIEGLKVISRTSVMRYKNTTKSLRQIGEELGVAAILEGSVRRAGDRVRITAQLIDAATDEHLWAERYDRDLEDIFAIQSDVAERIAEALRVRLSPDERARVAEKAPTSVEAYQRYLKGLHFWNRRTLEGMRRAVAEFEAAVAADPSYAPAHAGLGGAYVMYTTWDAADAADTLRRAGEAVERALALDPELGLAYAIRGQIRQREWSWDPAERDFERALASSPGDATARQWYAHHLGAMGRFEAALAEVERAVELDPLSLPVLTERANLLLYARRYEDAIRQYRHALEIDPSFLPARGLLGNLYHRLGRHDEALDQWREAGILSPEERASALEDGRVADRVIDRVREASRGAGAPPSFMALTCATNERVENAFAYLDQAVAIRDWALPTSAVNPLLDALRDDPRFDRLLDRIGLAVVSP